MAPGTVVYVGEHKTERVAVTVFHYDAQQFTEHSVTNVDELGAFLKRSSESAAGSPPPVTWINVDGLHDTALIEKVGSLLGLHPLVLEDIVNTIAITAIQAQGGASA